MALTYVVYQDRHGVPVESEAQSEESLKIINDIWRQCRIGFEIESYRTVVPESLGLNFRTAETLELDEIRNRFQTDRTLLVVLTGSWMRSGSLGWSWANAWTNLPGGNGAHGAILENEAISQPTVLAHELGHYLNLDHIENKARLMTPLIYPDSLDLSHDECRAARWAARHYWKAMIRD